MEWVKITAKTLPEAIDLALDNLGVDESEADIRVIEEPRQGLFGRMRGNARVEARVRPKPAKPKQERNRTRKGNRKNDRNKNRSKNRNDGGRNNEGGRNSGGRNNDGRNADNRKNDGGSNQGRRKGRGGKEREAGAQAEQTSDGHGNGAPQGQKKNGGRGRSGGGSRDGKPRNTNDQDSKPKEESPVEDVAEHLETFLTGLTEAFGFDSDVSIDSSEPDVLVGQIEGQHGLLVGPKGRTLDAVQELARISCQRTVPSSVRIKVDVGGYRQKRVEALQAFAAKAADSAVSSGSEVALEPMSPADRKAVHDALSEDDRVETRSVGSEPRRKVLVVPFVDEDEDYDDDVADAAGDDLDDTADALDTVEADADGDAGDDAGDDAVAEG